MVTFRKKNWAKRTLNTFGKLAKSTVTCFIVMSLSDNNLPPVVVRKEIKNESFYAAQINILISSDHIDKVFTHATREVPCEEQPYIKSGETEGKWIENINN